MAANSVLIIDGGYTLAAIPPQAELDCQELVNVAQKLSPDVNFGSQLYVVSFQWTKLKNYQV
jgi:hypothetical protein